MTGQNPIARLAVMPLPLLMTACSLVTPDYNAHCCLSVKFVQGGTTIKKLVYPANLSPYQQILAIATDPGGVKSITLSFSRTVRPCLGSTGLWYKNASGVSFYYQPVPANATLISTPVGSGAGMVLPELVAESALKGPYVCVQDISTGLLLYPFGTITATATATNYAGSIVTARLPILFEYAEAGGGRNQAMEPSPQTNQ
jgi:hypothetical protein